MAIRDRLLNLLQGERSEFKLKQLFYSYDPYKANVLHLSEVKTMCDRLELIEVDEPILKKAYEYIDADKDGGILFTEFRDFIIHGPQLK